MSNLGLERYLGTLGLTLARTAVGDRYVLEHMREHGYNIGGESSGHIILSDYATTGDGLVAALQVLAVVKKQDKPVSQVCHRFEPLPQVLRNVRYKKGKPLEDAKVQLAIKSAEQKLNGHGRLVIRPSGTEPVIRVMGEGDNKSLVEDAVDGIVEALTDVALLLRLGCSRTPGNSRKSEGRCQFRQPLKMADFFCPGAGAAVSIVPSLELFDDCLLLQCFQRPRCPRRCHGGGSAALARAGLWLPRLQRPMRPLRPHHPQDHGRGPRFRGAACNGCPATPEFPAW